MENFYEILEVNTNATNDEIKAAYHRMIKIHHPDKNDNSASSNLATKLIKDGYEILMDEEKRKEYDLKHGIKVLTPKIEYRYLESAQSDWLKPILSAAAMIFLIFALGFLFRSRE